MDYHLQPNFHTKFYYKQSIYNMFTSNSSKGGAKMQVLAMHTIQCRKLIVCTESSFCIY